MNRFCSRAFHPLLGAAALLLLLPLPDVAAQGDAGCETLDHRAFDFWVGDWEVSTTDGQPIGRSAISIRLDGCVIQEEWDSGAVKGMSHSVWDRATGTWYQTWLDNRGVRLSLSGGVREGVMVMEGERVEGDGVRRTFRISWTPLDDGRVRQRQEVSENGGESWQVAFEGLYDPAGAR